MALAVDSTSSLATSSNPMVVAHTCSGVDRVLLVFVMSTDGGGTPSVTYNGDAMTLIASRNVADQMKGFIFGLVDPDTGTNNISVSGVTPTRSTVFGISFTDCGGWDASATASADNSSSANAAVTVNTNKDSGFVVGAAIMNGSGVSLTYLGAGTEWANIDSDDASERGAAAYTSFTSGSNITQSWSKSTTAKWCAIGVEVYQAMVVINIDESITLQDSLLRTMSRSIAETITLDASLATAFIYAIFIENSLSLVDQVTKTMSRFFTESVTLVDGFARMLSRAINETITLVDDNEQIIGKVFNETLNISGNIVLYLNGFAVGIWTSTTRIVTSWSQSARVLTDWIKRDRQ